jgi:hypothetical protein
MYRDYLRFRPPLPTKLEEIKTVQACLALIISFFVGWDLWAMLVDNRPTYASDSALYYTLKAYLTGDLWQGLSILAHSRGKGITHCLLALLLAPPVGDVTLAARLISVISHGATIWIAHRLAVAMTGDRRAGLWSALLCGCSPMLFGWARLEFRESLLTATVAATLLMMQRTRLDRLRTDIGLGGLLGLGIMTKLSFVPFMVAPGLWLVATRARQPRTWGHLALALATMTILVLPWLIINWADICENAFASAAYTTAGPGQKALQYLQLPGVWWLSTLALLSVPLIWRQGRKVDRAAFLLLLLTAAGAMALFIFHFDYWSRYILPAFPPLAVLAGSGISILLRRLPARMGRLATSVLVLGASTLFVSWNLDPARLMGQADREYYAGMVGPDARSYDAYPRAVRQLPREAPVVVVFDSPEADTLPQTWMAWAARGLALMPASVDGARKLSAAGQPVYVLYVRRHTDPRVAATRMEALRPGDHLPRQRIQRLRRGYAWLHSLGLEPRHRFVDPDVIYEVYVVNP